jgi:dephospho-CoA kinase
MIITVTGKSGCGKSGFAKKLAASIQGSVYVDVDKVAHSAIASPEFKAYVAANLKELTPDFTRKQLGHVLFNNKQAYDEVTELMRVHMYEVIDALIADNEDSTMILDWWRICHTKYFAKSSLKFLCVRDQEKRFQAVMKREGITREYLELREQTAESYNERDFDYIVHFPE